MIVLRQKSHRFSGKVGFIGILMTDLSKSFDCIDLKVLFVKIHAYGFDTKSLRFIDIYLAGRKQGKRISIEY